MAGSLGGDENAIAYIWDDGTLNLSGGDFDPGQLVIADEGTLNLTVLELSIAGEVVPLNPGETFEIERRDGALLEAVLSDGSGFSFTLNELPTNTFGRPDLSQGSGLTTNAYLTATLVPEPATAVLWLGAAACTFRRRRAQ